MLTPVGFIGWMLLLHVVFKQLSRAKLCRASQYLTRLVADTIVTLNVRPQIVNGRERFATIRDVTLHIYRHHRPICLSTNQII